MTGMKKSLPAAALVMVMLLSLLAGCGQAPASAANAASAAKSAVQAQAYIDGSAVQDADISEEAVALLGRHARHIRSDARGLRHGLSAAAARPPSIIPTPPTAM
jgi:type IV pilus biogenesis protein CpaD/CtpE